MLFHSPRSTARSGKNFLVAKHYKKEVIAVRKHAFILVLVALIAAILVVPTQASAWDRCGGQVYNSTQLYNAWKKQGILGDPSLKKILRSAGYRSVDGSIKQFLRDRVMIGKARTTVIIDNFGCGGGRIGGVGPKTLSKGWPIAYVLPGKYSKKDVSTRKRKGYKAVVVKVHLVGQASCSNPGKAVTKVTIFVKINKIKPKPKTKAKPKTTPPALAPISCPVNLPFPVLTNVGIACQSNSSTQTADQKSNVENDCKGPNTNSSQCQTSITNIIQQTTIQVNANCSKVTITNSDGLTLVEYKDNNGNVVTESYCSTTVIEQPPICTHDCFPHVDQGPQISCTSGAHSMMVPGSMVVLYCESSDPEGDAISVNIESEDRNVVTVSGIDNHYEYLFDGKTPCPSGSVCTKANIWAHQLGLAGVTATATANGKEGTFTGWFPVVAGDPSNF